jgi:hypothetical protein
VRVRVNLNYFKIKKLNFLLNNISMTILWGKNKFKHMICKWKTFVGNTRINKKYFAYLKPSFDL